MKKTFGTVFVSLLLVSCGVSGATPIKKASDKLGSYFEAKQEFAQTLQQQIGGSTGSNIYRLVSLSGPAYPIGALISSDNTLDLESRDCVLPDALLPDPEPWNGLPSWSSAGTLDLGLGLPSLWQSAISGGQSSLDAGFSMDRESFFQIEDISQVFLAKSELREALAEPQCQAALQDIPSEDVIFVRGLVYGRESLRSAKAVAANVDFSLVSDSSGDFSFGFNNSGAFELRENTIVPKFAVVAKLTLSESGDADFRTGADERTGVDERAFDLTRPSDADIAALQDRLAQKPSED